MELCTYLLRETREARSTMHLSSHERVRREQTGRKICPDKMTEVRSVQWKQRGNEVERTRSYERSLVRLQVRHDASTLS